MADNLILSDYAAPQSEGLIYHHFDWKKALDELVIEEQTIFFSPVMKTREKGAAIKRVRKYYMEQLPTKFQRLENKRRLNYSIDEKADEFKKTYGYKRMKFEGSDIYILYGNIWDLETEGAAIWHIQRQFDSRRSFGGITQKEAKDILEIIRR